MEAPDSPLRFVAVDAVVEETRRAIVHAKGNDAFAPVWVWAPHARAADALSQRLTRLGGLVNVSFFTGESLMRELAGVDALPLRRLGSVLQREIGRQVLAGARAPLSGHRGSNVIDAFVYSLNELRSRSDGEVELIAESDDAMARELVRLYDVYRSRVEGRFYDLRDFHAMVSTVDDPHPPVVAVVTEPPDWMHGDLLAKTMKRAGSAVIAVEAGEAGVDDALHVWLWGIGTPTRSDTPTDAMDLDAVSEFVVVAPDAMAEVDIALAEVMQAAEAGVAFSSMAILFPESSPHGPLLASRLSATGIPFKGKSRTRMHQTPVGRFVVNTLQIVQTEFSIDSLHAWISEPCIRDPLTGARPEIGDWMDAIRRANATGGSTETVQRLLAYAETLTRPDQMRLRMAAQSCAALVTDLSATCGLMPATWGEWAQMVQRCINRYVGTANDRADWPRAQQVAATAIETRIKQIEALDSVRKEEVVAHIAIDIFMASLSKALPGANDPKGVLVGSFADAVCAHFDVVVLCGLNEGFLPMADSRGALQVALRVPGEEQLAERQRRAFLHAVMSGSKRVLVCARTDQRAQRERLPSPWLLERASVLAGRGVRAGDLLEERAEWPWLSVVPSFSALLARDSLFAAPSFDELRSLSAWTRASQPALEHPSLAVSNERRGVALVAARDGSAMTPFDGAVGPHHRVADLLLQPVSATKFESWATCPARFFYDSVLSLVDREADDRQLGLSGRHRGTAVHDILERFIVSVPKRDQPSQPWSIEERAMLHTFADEAFDNAVDSGLSQPGLLHRIERRRLHEELDTFLEDDERLRVQFAVVPVGAEVAFGTGDVPPLSVPRSSYNRQPVRFRGRIDRLDRSPDGKKALVIDYKTGKKSYLVAPKNDSLAAGTKLQLAIYGAAVRQQGNESVEVTSGYWATSDTSVRDPFVVLPYDHEVEARLSDVVDLVATGMESGFFAAIPGAEDRDSFKNCRMCAFDDICVADRDESWERKSGDASTVPWRSLQVGTKTKDAT